MTTLMKYYIFSVCRTASFVHGQLSDSMNTSLWLPPPDKDLQVGVQPHLPIVQRIFANSPGDGFVINMLLSQNSFMAAIGEVFLLQAFKVTMVMVVMMVMMMVVMMMVMVILLSVSRPHGLVPPVMSSS